VSGNVRTLSKSRHCRKISIGGRSADVGMWTEGQSGGRDDIMERSVFKGIQDEKINEPTAIT
jgi:hypothetical protein